MNAYSHSTLQSNSIECTRDILCDYIYIYMCVCVCVGVYIVFFPIFATLLFPRSMIFSLILVWLSVFFINMRFFSRLNCGIEYISWKKYKIECRLLQNIDKTAINRMKEGKRQQYSASSIKWNGNLCRSPRERERDQTLIKTHSNRMQSNAIQYTAQ